MEYWNTAAGEKWVRHQAVMDQQLEIVTDLLLQTAAIRAGEAVLDVGWGTGATLLRVAAAVGEEGQVLGCDVSAPMLALTRERIAAAPSAMSIWFRPTRRRTTSPTKPSTSWYRVSG